MANIVWIAGDRYLCVEKKKEIINNLKKKNSYSVKSLDNFDDTDSFCSESQTTSLFGEENFIITYDGEFTDLNKVIKFIENSNSVNFYIFTHLGKNIDKRKREYTLLKDYLIEFPIIMSERGTPSRDSIDKAKFMICDFIDWKGGDSVFSEIFKICNYDYGMTINEIKKIRDYNDGKDPNKIEEVLPILCSPISPEVFDLIELIKKGDLKGSLKKYNEIEFIYDIEDYGMGIISLIEENYSFLLTCSLAVESGNRSQESIADYISKNWKKNNRDQDYNSIYRRLFYYKDVIENPDSKKYLYCQIIIEKALKSFILKEKSYHYIFNRLITSII